MRHKSKAATNLLAFLCVCLAFTSSCNDASKSSNIVAPTPGPVAPPPELEKAKLLVEPFFQHMAPPAPTDWLASHKEPGQTFEEYLNENPTLPTSQRQIIYILPLGKF